MFADLLRERLAGVLEITPQQAARLGEHYTLMMRWNEKLNLTSLRRVEDVIVRHYCESLFVAAHLPQMPGSMADVGSGAGFPGTPVAIMRPDWRVTLIESHRRKAVFLRESTRDLPNVTVVAERAEAVSGRFEVAVCRAVSPETVIKDMQRLAERVAILCGAQPCPPLSGGEWQRLPLPWGQHRFLCLSSHQCST